MSERNNRKQRVGIVVSDKMDKTIVVAVTEHVRHPLYKKYIRRAQRVRRRRPCPSDGDKTFEP
jgi:small subunit ribosomal protein S17